MAHTLYVITHDAAASKSESSIIWTDQTHPRMNKHSSAPLLLIPDLCLNERSTRLKWKNKQTERNKTPTLYHWAGHQCVLKIISRKSTLLIACEKMINFRRGWKKRLSKDSVIIVGVVIWKCRGTWVCVWVVHKHVCQANVLTILTKQIWIRPHGAIIIIIIIIIVIKHLL